MNKYQPKVDPNNVLTNVELYSCISDYLAEKVEKGLDITQKAVDSKNLVVIG
jgi:hypothetical protein